MVLAGQGIAALQEAGVLDVHPIAGPRIPMLGVYPDLLGATLQALVLLVVVAAAFRRSRSARPPRPAAPAD